MFRWFLPYPPPHTHPTTSAAATNCCRRLLRACILHVQASSSVDDYRFVLCSHSFSSFPAPFSCCACPATRAAFVVRQWWMVAFALSSRTLLAAGYKTTSTQQLHVGLLGNCVHPLQSLLEKLLKWLSLLKANNGSELYCVWSSFLIELNFLKEAIHWIWPYFMISGIFRLL